MESAIVEYRNGGPCKIIAKKHGVPSRTLRRMINSPQLLSKPSHSRRLLSELEETRIKEWAFQMADLGWPLNREMLSAKILSLIDDGRDRCNVPKDAVTLGTSFWKGFEARHPDFVSRVFQPLEKSRTDGNQEALIDDYINKLSSLLETYGVYGLHLTQFWNLDESGIDLTFPRHSSTVGFSSRKSLLFFECPSCLEKSWDHFFQQEYFRRIF